MDQNSPHATIMSLQRAIEDQRRDLERIMSSSIKSMMLDAVRDGMDMRLFETMFKDAKADTEQALVQVIVQQKEVHNAVSWTIPTKLSEMVSSLRTIENRVQQSPQEYRLMPANGTSYEALSPARKDLRGMM